MIDKRVEVLVEGQTSGKLSVRERCDLCRKLSKIVNEERPKGLLGEFLRKLGWI